LPLVDVVILWERVVQISIFCLFRHFTNLLLAARLKRFVDWTAIFFGSVTLIFDFSFLWGRVTINHWSCLELGALVMTAKVTLRSQTFKMASFKWLFLALHERVVIIWYLCCSIYSIYVVYLRWWV
jgi:hypothetical protein